MPQFVSISTTLSSLTGALFWPLSPARTVTTSAAEQVDVPYQYLTFFMEDDEELKRIGEMQDADVSPGDGANHHRLPHPDTTTVLYFSTLSVCNGLHLPGTLLWKEA